MAKTVWLLLGSTNMQDDLLTSEVVIQKWIYLMVSKLLHQIQHIKVIANVTA